MSSTTSELLSSPVVSTLLSRSPPAPLTAGRVWRSDLTPQINQLSAGLNVRAVLHLLNDDFEGCHNLAQTQEGNPYSDHLHCIAHRREPDYWNSKYWIARLSHPHLAELYAPDVAGASVSQAKKAAEKFVDAVQRAESSGKGVAELELRQWVEMTKLTKILIEMDGKEKRR
ncbi:hypothetical protein HYDPIDRAFT_112307 [Hydnomerulius pinastri MD-312]|uniref:Unplaced genomic scaffold scaffold_13, whole genome shotgun sequence n=1 Tax=Hydnomerulius pinastri MD-312 TaxID=994086 RepID=A0A0C9WFM9_9AGAM|nr:hypothetical protein HYDPIDRAFT_112307 [Hydnomerulius pinastri MD-312]